MIAGNVEVHEAGDDVRRAKNVYHGVADRAKNVLLLVGNEGSGIPEELLRFCDRNIFVRPGRDLHPMLDSLNVSVATALVVQFLKNKYLA